MTMSASVRGIARTNQIEAARMANAMEIGIAERGSMSIRVLGAGVSGSGGGMSRSEGPSKLAGTSLSYE